MTAAPAPAAVAAGVVRGGVTILEAIAGAGLLLLPAIILATAGESRSVPAWVTHAAVGAACCAILGVAALHLPGRLTVADLVGATLGARFARTVTALYLAGFIFGQAAIGYAAGGLLGAGFGLAGPGPAGLGVGVLVLAAGGVVAGRPLPAPARRARLALTVLLATYLSLSPALPAAAGLSVGLPGGFWVAVLLLFFAYVGWERMIRVAPGLGGAGRVAAAAAVAAVLATGGYAGLTLILAGTTGAGPPPPLTLLDRGAAVAAAAVLAAYCLTNIEAAGGFLRTLAPVPQRWAPVLVATTAGAVLTAVAVAGWPLAALLLGPAVAALTSYALAMAGVLRRGPWATRPAAAAVLAGLGAFAILAAMQWLLSSGAVAAPQM